MIDRLYDRPAFRTPTSPEYRSFELHPGALTARQCERLIRQADEIGLSDAGLEGAGGSEDPDPTIRRARTAWLGPTDQHWWIYERLARVVERANRRYGFDLTGFDEDLQYTVYDQPGSFYTWHQDGLDSTVAHRKLSIVVQLSDPDSYQGGELQFFDVVDDFDDDELAAFTFDSTRQGVAMVFPSFEYHRVLALRGGERRSLVAWVSGPPFR